MEIKYKVSGNRLYIYLHGELDEHCAKIARDCMDKLIQKTNKDITIFNFSHLSFMDSTGIGMLLGRYKLLKSLNKRAYIENPSNTIEKIIQISGIYDIMPKI